MTRIFYIQRYENIQKQNSIVIQVALLKGFTFQNKGIVSRNKNCAKAQSFKSTNTSHRECLFHVIYITNTLCARSQSPLYLCKPTSFKHYCLYYTSWAKTGGPSSSFMPLKNKIIIFFLPSPSSQSPA